MNPAMRTLSPASTRIRVEIFARRESAVGVALGVTRGVAVGVAVAAGVAVAVAVGVALGVAVAVAVPVGVAAGVAVAVAVGEGGGVGGGHGRSHLPAFTISLPQSPLWPSKLSKALRATVVCPRLTGRNATRG